MEFSCKHLKYFWVTLPTTAFEGSCSTEDLDFSPLLALLTLVGFSAISVSPDSDTLDFLDALLSAVNSY
jgi:hypothetical protein